VVAGDKEEEELVWQTNEGEEGRTRTMTRRR
jgi:hypothetical protein